MKMFHVIGVGGDLWQKLLLSLGFSDDNSSQAALLSGTALSMQRVEKGDRSEWSGALISDSPLFSPLPQQLHQVPF